MAEEQVREFAQLADERQMGALADESPYLAEVVARSPKSATTFAAAFAYGLDLIPDAPEQRRDTAP